MEYGPVPAKAVGEQSYTNKYWISNRFVKVIRIVVYGPPAAKAVREQKHTGKMLDF